MNYIFKPTRLKEIHELVQEYLNSLLSPIDSFLEGHILESQIYLISENQNTIGYFALHKGKKEKLLTQFYLRKNFLKEGQRIFKEILNQFSVKSAFIPTCDELFLSHAIDQDTRIKKQAYFFQDNKEIDVSNKLYQGGEFRVANPSDIAEIKEISGDFFDKLEERIAKSEIFVFTEDSILLGAGIIEKGKLLKEYTSIGMFTNELYRRKGIGKSIIIHLKRWCYENGQIPISGCWYYNINSKRTLESAGMITKTRLLNVHFLKSNEARE